MRKTPAVIVNNIIKSLPTADRETPQNMLGFLSLPLSIKRIVPEPLPNLSKTLFFRLIIKPLGKKNKYIYIYNKK